MKPMEPALKTLKENKGAQKLFGHLQQKEADSKRCMWLAGFFQVLYT